MKLLTSILVLFTLPFVHTSNIRSHQFRPLAKLAYWFFVGNFFILTYIGAQPPEYPWVTIGQLASIFYFSYFFKIYKLIFQN